MKNLNKPLCLVTDIYYIIFFNKVSVENDSFFDVVCDRVSSIDGHVLFFFFFRFPLNLLLSLFI